VSNSAVDTQGLIYPRALQHLLVGCYLSIVCLIGLFAIGTSSQRIALGPLVLMIIFLVFAVLYHVSLNAALEPLIKYLPKNLEAEEEALLMEAHPTTDGSNTVGNVGSARNRHDNGVEAVDSAEKGIIPPTALPAPHKKPNLFMKFLRPDKYTDYATLRRLVPTHLDVPEYPPEVERDAYLHPSITSKLPLLWIPRDEAGVSKQEVHHTSQVMPITDEEAWFDEKNKLQWNIEKGRPPIYEEKIYY
jgi:hypothetical protein